VIAKNLLKHFGSVKAIVNATVEELKQVDKVGEKTANKIKEVMDSEYRPRD
jgi:Fanconi anemia group M protein